MFDANEAESWMSEQELYMMVEDRGKDEFSAQNLMEKNMRFWKICGRLCGDSKTAW